MDPQLNEALKNFRRSRGFSARAYLTGKARLLNDYLSATGVSACIVGVSGGIDSAVTLGILRHASRQPGSPIRRLVAALMPMFVPAGATNQSEATERGRKVAEAFSAELALVDLSSGLTALKSCVDAGAASVGEPWAAGQLVSYIRTPALYYLSALLSEQGSLAVVCGTTNRDEGSYIGFFGKASDGMVDIQPISDIHKSEVRELAALLDVPQSVIAATPTGDTYDGRPDEAMIGAPYDFVELYEHWLCLPDDGARDRILAGLGESALAEWRGWSAAIESLHGKNLHKYLAGSCAVHLDIYDRAVPGGWRSECARSSAPDPSPSGKLVGEFELGPQTLGRIGTGVSGRCVRKGILDFGDSAFTVEGVLAAGECEALYEVIAAQARVAVGQNGMLSDFDPGRDKVGSYRATAYSPELAGRIWERLSGVLPCVRTMDDLTPTDWKGQRVWRAIGVNPVLRFIWYQGGGLLVPHYDAGYDYRDGHRYTLMSLVVYLTDVPAGQGGQTRFLIDSQRHLPLELRNFEDWTRLARQSEVLAGVRPCRGNALIFDHRVLHDGETWQGDGARLLLRSDIVFERCGLLPGRLPARARPKAGLWEDLGLAPDSSGEAVDRAFTARTAGRQPTAQERFDWKMLRDPYYSFAYTLLGSRQAAIDGGFFEDTAPPGDDGDPRRQPEWMSTPLHKILSRLAELPPSDERPLCALITTGAFCPVHKGHVEMMELARSEAESRGWCVLGGYLSPGHDEYVQAKCGADAPGAAHRARLCQEAVSGSEWLMVDPWEALHTSCAVNFTDVVARLERYLSLHVRCARPVEVFYVCGSDNARFSLAFAARGRCICVPRPGYESRLGEYAEREGIRGNPRVIMSCGPASLDAASCRVRGGDHSLLDQPVRERWSRWREPGQGGTTPRAWLQLRDEGAWSTAHWSGLCRPDALAGAWRELVAGLEKLLHESFTAVESPDRMHEPEIRKVTLEDQAARARELGAGKRLLSLDPCLPGDCNVAVSRCFALCDGSVPPRLVARPGAPTIEQQLAAIVPGDYLLLDDDSVSGYTVSTVLSFLPRECRVARVEKLATIASNGAEVSDLGDCRDFLLGSNEGGLVVELPSGVLARAPYCLPYVQPAARLSIPDSSERRLSIGIWSLNESFFRRLDPCPRVADAAPATRELLEYLGFAPDVTLLEVARWHLERLR